MTAKHISTGRLGGFRPFLALLMVTVGVAGDLGPALAASRAPAYGWSRGPSLPAASVGLDSSYSYFPPLEQLVMFGGAPSPAVNTWSNATWILADGASSWKRGPLTPPELSPRGGAAMAYFPQTQRIVLFGGSDATWPPSNETWLYDGDGWSPGPAAPPALQGRTGAEMVYDPLIGKLVLFGGSGTAAYRDTWMFDGTGWTQGPDAPDDMSPRAFFGMVFDPAAGKVLVAGGDGGTRTWYFDGKSWTPGPGFPDKIGPRERFRMAYDQNLGGAVLFGGIGGPGGAPKSMWLLKGGRWYSITQRSTGSPSWPTRRMDGGLLWSSSRSALVLVGGSLVSENHPGAIDDLWFFRGDPDAIDRSRALAAPRGSGGYQEGTWARPAVVPSDEIVAASQGQVVAGAGRFWLNGAPFVPKGIKTNVDRGGNEIELLRFAQWGFNTVRFTVRWSKLEPSPPIPDGSGGWIHTFDARYFADLVHDVQWAAADGLWVVLTQNGCGCSYFRRPDWLYEHQYNSHGIDYPRTDAGRTQAETDFWSDDLRQQFLQEMWATLAGQLDGMPGVIGYEIQNEPDRADLPATAPTTQLILDRQLVVAQAIRQADPERVVFFTTWGGNGPGLPLADLSGWQLLGNVAFDVHDYFGGRWGDGLLDAPGSAENEQSSQVLYLRTCADDAPPYLGIALSHERLLGQAMKELSPYGIPLLVGEFGTSWEDPGVFNFFGTVMSAMSNLGLGWTVPGSEWGITDGSELRPWASIVTDTLP